MYLIITEDGAVQTMTEVTDDDLEAVDVGYLQVIDITGCDEPKEFYEGGWHPVDAADDGK